MPILFDAHCHAAQTLPASAPPPDPERRRLVCGVAPGDWPAVADWAERWPGTIPAFGVHPWEAALRDGVWEQELEALLLRFPAAWVGEIGLDAAKADRAPLERQRDVFARQLRIARRLRRRVSLHCVRARDALLAALDREYFPSGGRAFLLHAFAGPPAARDAFAARGAYFSVGPRAARRGSRDARAFAAGLPEARLLLESDAFLEPGRDAEEDLLFTLHWLADARNVPAEALARALADNARRILDNDA